MHAATRKALRQRSVPTDLITNIGKQGHTVESLAGLTLEELRSFYTEDEASLIHSKVHREPIDGEVLARILTASGEVCAYCADGNSARPFEIHHIVYWSISQDNSEDNLLLVCPTHHTTIHKRAISAELQKKQRQEWYSLREVALEFQARGVSVPYTMLTPIGFDGPVRPTEILGPGGPSPATAKAIARHDLARHLVARLQTENFIMLEGHSGSGKSTLALGVAGCVAGTRTFRYRPPQDKREALPQVLQTMAVLTKPTILILDDVNRWASPDEVATLRKACSSTARIVATKTEGIGDLIAPAGDAELVSWDALQGSVQDTILDSEAEFVAALQSRTANAHWPPVGMGYMDRSVGSLVDEYLPKSTTVWQFTFLLGGGWRHVANELHKLVSDYRADVPVLVAAVEQIAGVEEPVTIDECVAVTNQALPNLRPAASPEWVGEVFAKLVATRLMIRVRDRYTTVH
ncbi:MAG: HNH endonuclease, partial [Polyangiales bacterium]